MNLDDWEFIWRRQEPPTGAGAEIATLKQTFETQRRKTERMLMVRDLSEGAAALLVCAAMAPVWWKLGKTGWPIGVAILLSLGLAGFFGRERMRVRRSRLGADAPLLAKLEGQIAELNHQRRLLRNIWSWYLGPIAAVIAIVVATIAYHRPYIDPLFLGGMGIFFALCLGFAWWLNWRAVRTHLDPRIEELKKLRSDLLSE